MIEIPQKYIDRFWSKVDIRGPDECWPWLAGKFDNGYGAFDFCGKLMKAHRFAYMSTIGPIPDEIIIRHDCDNKPCCNPKCLIPGSHVDNVKDRDSRGRTARGERVGASKLTAEQVRHIRIDRRTQRDIAKTYGVCKSTVGYIKRGENWTHV